MTQQDILMEMTREIDRLKEELRRQASLRPQFTVLNHTTVENITADQNNYTLGDFDFIFLNPTANRIINGIANGVKGRMLYIVNAGIAGAFTISFTHQNAAATSTNRIVTATAGTIAINVRRSAILTYTNDVAITPAGAGKWYLLQPQA